MKRLDAMKRFSAKPQRSGQHGFTLLEVLVAMVVLSVGLLGLSGLQTSSLRNNHNAFLRSQATIVASDILDRMRANRGSAIAGNYDINYTTAASSVSCSGTCSELVVAQMDVAEWRTYVERLPGGEGEISVNADGIAEVKVCWSDTRENSLPCNDSNTTKLELVTRTRI